MGSLANPYEMDFFNRHQARLETYGDSTARSWLQPGADVNDTLQGVAAMLRDLGIDDPAQCEHLTLGLVQAVLQRHDAAATEGSQG